MENVTPRFAVIDDQFRVGHGGPLPGSGMRQVGTFPELGVPTDTTTPSSEKTKN